MAIHGPPSPLADGGRWTRGFLVNPLPAPPSLGAAVPGTLGSLVAFQTSELVRSFAALPGPAVGDRLTAAAPSPGLTGSEATRVMAARGGAVCAKSQKDRQPSGPGRGGLPAQPDAGTLRRSQGNARRDGGTATVQAPGTATPGSLGTAGEVQGPPSPPTQPGEGRADSAPMGSAWPQIKAIIIIIFSCIYTKHGWTPFSRFPEQRRIPSICMAFTWYLVLQVAWRWFTVGRGWCRCSANAAPPHRGTWASLDLYIYRHSQNQSSVNMEGGRYCSCPYLFLSFWY